MKCLHCGNETDTEFVSFEFGWDRANFTQCMNCGCIVEVQKPKTNYRAEFALDEYVIPKQSSAPVLEVDWNRMPKVVVAVGLYPDGSIKAFFNNGDCTSLNSIWVADGVNLSGAVVINHFRYQTEDCEYVVKRPV